MKKSIIVFISIIFIYLMFGYVNAEKNIIPDDAIRLRIVPNSDSKYDQEIKMKVKEKIEYQMFNLLKNTKGIEEARTVINNNMYVLDNNVKQVLTKHNYKLGYKLDYGMHYFPQKQYKGITYKEGDYESLLITLGEGKGSNWWCVLFPPLCLIEADEGTNPEKVEYKSFIQEIIKKYM